MREFAERAQAAVEDGDMAEASVWFGKALAQNPDDIGARAWLGQCLCSLGKRAEGLMLLREATRRLVPLAEQSGHVEMLLELIGELQQWSDFDGALEFGRHAIRIAPDKPQGHHLLALAHAQLNQLPEALEAGERALALAPASVAIKVLLGSLEADAGRNEAARARLETVLAESPEPREAFRAHKELARVCDKLRDYGQVFPHLRQAAALSLSLPEYTELNSAALHAMIASNRAGFDRALVGHWAGATFAPGRPPPVFVMGFMRSGTTLTQEVLGAHPDVFVSDEVDFIAMTLRELHRMNPARLSTTDKLRQLRFDDVLALRQFYWTKVTERFGDAVGEKLFVDKFTMNTIDAGLINFIFPDARIVFVQRDPRDICLSCFMQLMVPSLATAQLLQWDGTARFYAEVMGWWLHVRPLMTMDVVEFRYEDAISGFETTFRRIFAGIGLAWDPSVIDFHRGVTGRFIASPSRNQVAQPLYSSSVARWRRFETEFAPIAATLQPFVTAFGYEPS